jgi:hypothetical protein
MAAAQEGMTAPAFERLTCPAENVLCFIVQDSKKPSREIRFFSFVSGRRREKELSGKYPEEKQFSG